jgi:hypothetical protein
MGFFSSFTYKCSCKRVCGLKIKAGKSSVQKCIKCHEKHYAAKDGVPF